MLNMPVQVPIKNPIDLLAQGWADPRIFADSFKLILNECQFDAVMIVFSPNYQEGIGGGVPISEIIEASSKVSKPVVSVLTSPDSRKPPGHDVLEAAGIPFFSSPQRAAQALANLLKLST
jgi:acyl-CoA synthetase (NDP forming)